MELQQYLRILRRYWRSAVASVLVCIAAAAAFTLLQTPTYVASSSVFLIVESGESASDLSQGATYAERQVESYVAVAETSLVLQPVISELGLDMTPAELAGRVTVSAPASTSIIEITVQDPSPQQAALLANTISSSLLNAVDVLSPAGDDGSHLVSARVINPAVVPGGPSAPRPSLNLLLGAVVGVLIGLGQAVLRSVLDTRLRSTEDVEKVTTAPVLASIGRTHGVGERDANAQWSSSESYRRLRTNVGFVGLGGERRPSMVMTSSVASEGKTETVVNLARVLAEAGESVLLVDADLRRPQVGNRMGLDSQLGMSDVLTGRGTLADLTIPVTPYLSVLPAGTIPPNPSELLGSEAMAHLLATVERHYDYVLFDAPPLLPVTDAVVLSAQTAGAIMVARSGIVTKAQLANALELLDAGEVTVLGLVLNDVPVKDQTGYYYKQYTSHEEPKAELPASV